jgi:hypothetical protein
VQPFGPAWLIAMVVAVTAPVLSACPFAVTHSPTLSALALADSAFV